MSKITSISITFPVPVEMTEETNRFLDEALTAVCEDYENDNPDRVMWVFGQGGTPPAGWLHGEPEGEWDMAAFNIEIAERERYEGETTIQRSDLRRAFHERDKFRDQVIDTCKRAERAEKALQDETGWLIERRDPDTYRPAWLSLRVTALMGSALGSWEYDSLYALRFGRQCDAEDYVRANKLEGCTVTDHAWIGARSMKRTHAENDPAQETHE